MFLRLFMKELKITFRSVTFIISAICILAFYIIQFSGLTMIKEPKNLLVEEKKENQIMISTLSELSIEYLENTFITYPLGIYKKISLEDKQLIQIKEILCDVTGLSVSDISMKVANYREASVKNGEAQNYISEISINLNNYDLFIEKMQMVDDILGGNSKYSKERFTIEMNNYMSINEQLKDYEELVNGDKITGAYARYFVDNMGIIMALVPVFICTNRVMKDKKNNMIDVIGSKKISSFTIIISRYSACVVSFILLLVLLSIIPLIKTMSYANRIGMRGDILAYIKYILLWLLPTVLFVCALAFFFTELTQSVIVVFIQSIWWYICVFFLDDNLVGNIRMNLIPRFNVIGYRHKFLSIFPELCKNRILYLFFSLILLGLSIWVYKLNRSGRRKIWKNII